MIESLSVATAKYIQERGKTLTFSYAYDNFDVDLKPKQLLIENSTDSLQNLTSATMLNHGLNASDFRCANCIDRRSSARTRRIGPRREQGPQSRRGLGVGCGRDGALGALMAGGEVRVKM